MENLVISPAFWRGRRVFLTGHTGFKGSWLTLMLARLGARTTGFALEAPTQPNLFALAHVQGHIADLRGDIRDLHPLSRAMQAAQPEIIIHMAAQPLVRASYDDPVATYATNVMGTAHVLEAARHVAGVRAILIVTTDKCYQNREWVWGYRETDALGGHDPYASSKACAELVTSAYRDSFFGASEDIRIISARAGNVIGGGDFAADRIIPDAVRAVLAGRELKVRSPSAVRPWQHVLEPLSGYLRLIETALAGNAAGDALSSGGFNFGPEPDAERSVSCLLDAFFAAWGVQARWAQDEGPYPHETHVLRLDTAKARALLGWRPLLSFDETIQWTADWHRAFVTGGDVAEATSRQIDAYLTRAALQHLLIVS